MKKVSVFWSNRSERGLLEPVIRRLEKHFEVIRFDMGRHGMSEFGDIYKSAYALFQEKRPAAVMCPFDRCEMIFPTLAAYHLNIPVIALQSGDISGGTFDDLHRHTIALYASIHLCNGSKSAERTKELLRLAGKDPSRVYDVGSFSLDDLTIDEGLVPPDQYLLVLYNPVTRFPELIPGELDEIETMLDKPTIWIEPNGDMNSDSIIARAKELEAKGKVTYYANLPRPKFLGLLKNASKYISNSSSLLFEAPHFLRPEQIVHVGIRNRGREPVELKRGGSDKIVEVLRKELADA
ncbi:MAG: UDP-N-acetylglucosamine 2-epimerase [Desulfobacterales bacterium]|nr:UDP-N-acetylglucosamine 2-epimerase [Desulfobacterales bacterium]